MEKKQEYSRTVRHGVVAHVSEVAVNDEAQIANIVAFRVYQLSQNVTK